MVALRVCALALSLVVCAGCSGARVPWALMPRESAVAAAGWKPARDSNGVLEHSVARPLVVRAVAPDASARDGWPVEVAGSRSAAENPRFGPAGAGDLLAERPEGEAAPEDPQAPSEPPQAALVQDATINTRIGDALGVVVDEPPAADAATPDTRWLRAQAAEFGSEVWQDATNFYDWETLAKFGAGLGIAAISANTTIDGKFDAWFQHHVRSSTTDGITHNIKWVGDGVYTVPLAAGLYLLGEIAPDMPYAADVSRFGDRTLRGFAVGVVPMLTMQVVLGSDRPRQSPEGSTWTPFATSHGVSGDAFMGAMPFLAAAGMTDNRLAKAALYAASIVPALGRIDYDKHYLSQAALGWFMAYLSMMAVNDTDAERSQGQIVPLWQPNEYGIAAEYRW